MKTKVIYIISTLETSGPANILYNIILHLNRELFEPVIITLSKEPAKSRKQDFTDLQVQVVSLSLTRLQGLLFAGSELQELLQDIRPHIIHTHSYRADALAASHLKLYPRVATLHANLADNYVDTYGKVAGLLIARHQIRALKELDLVIACSKTLYEFYRPTFKNLTYIQNGVLLAPSRANGAVSKISACQKLRIPSGKLVFIAVGSLTERKDPLTIIHSFKASERFGDSVLLLAGEGVLKEKCQELAAGCSNIVILGQVSQVNDYLAAADYYISASWSEGLPTSVLEALACRLPVILSRIGPHQEILELNPGAGADFNPGDTAGLVKLLNQVSRVGYDAKSQAALNIVTTHLNARNMARKYEEVYSELLRSKA